MQFVTVEHLKRLIEPFLGHRECLYLTRFGIKLYVGVTPAHAYADSEEKPVNFVLEPVTLEDAVLEDMAKKLNDLEASRG